MSVERDLLRIRNNPRDVRFAVLKRVVEAFGFELRRVSGSHHIYTHPDITEGLNLQRRGSKAKPYQVRQFLALVEKYELAPHKGVHEDENENEEEKEED